MLESPVKPEDQHTSCGGGRRRVQRGEGVERGGVERGGVERRGYEGVYEGGR